MKIWFRWASGKLWYLQHNCVGDTIVYHLPSDFQVLANNFSSNMVHFSQGCNIYPWYVTIQPYYWGGRLWNMAITWVTTLKIQIVAFCKELHRWHTFGSCLIRCVNMNWIWLVLWKLKSGHDSVHRRMDRRKDGQMDGRTDGPRETSIPPFNFIEAGIIMMWILSWPHWPLRDAAVISNH